MQENQCSIYYLVSAWIYELLEIQTSREKRIVYEHDLLDNVLRDLIDHRSGTFVIRCKWNSTM